MASFNLTTEQRSKHSSTPSSYGAHGDSILFFRTNMLTLTSQKNKSSQLNVHCRCMSFICSVFRRSAPSTCLVAMATYEYDVPLFIQFHGAIVFYVFKDRNTRRGRGIMATIDETLKGLRGSLPI